MESIVKNPVVDKKKENKYGKESFDGRDNSSKSIYRCNESKEFIAKAHFLRRKSSGRFKNLRSAIHRRKKSR